MLFISALQVIKKEAVSTSSKASPFGYENSTPSLVSFRRDSDAAAVGNAPASKAGGKKRFQSAANAIATPTPLSDSNSDIELFSQKVALCYIAHKYCY